MKRSLRANSDMKGIQWVDTGATMWKSVRVLGLDEPIQRYPRRLRFGY